MQSSFPHFRLHRTVYHNFAFVNHASFVEKVRRTKHICRSDNNNFLDCVLCDIEINDLGQKFLVDEDVVANPLVIAQNMCALPENSSNTSCRLECSKLFEDLTYK